MKYGCSRHSVLSRVLFAVIVFARVTSMGNKKKHALGVLFDLGSNKVALIDIETSDEAVKNHCARMREHKLYPEFDHITRANGCFF